MSFGRVLYSGIQSGGTWVHPAGTVLQIMSGLELGTASERLWRNKRMYNRIWLIY